MNIASTVPAADLPAVLTIRQAAAWIGVHPRTVRTWIDAGRLPSSKDGPARNRHGMIRIAREDVVRYATGKQMSVLAGVC